MSGPVRDTGHGERVSVVLPVHDDVEYVGAAVERALALTGVDVELVLVDDGSTDGSTAVVREAAARDPRVRAVVLERNVGVARARERGVARATGDWVWFVDSDDSWEPGAAAVLLTLAGRAPDVDVVVAAARLVEPSGSSRPIVPVGPPLVDGSTALGLLLEGAVTGHLWNKLFRRDLLLRVEFVPARTQSDLALVAGALVAARRVVLDRQVVYTYLKREGSVITSVGRRSESLALVEAAVVGAAGAAERAGSAVPPGALAYFRTRYVVLSGMKDAAQGRYSASERAALQARWRARITPGALLALAARRDARRLALALAAKASPALHRRLLAVADR